MSKDSLGKKTVFGIYKNHMDIESSLEELIGEGFKPNSFSVLIPVSQDKGKSAQEPNYNKPEEITGGIIGSLLGVGTVLVTGGLSLFIAGPILPELAGAGVLASASAMIGFLISRTLGNHRIPDDELYKLMNVVKEGGHLLLVHIDNADQAEKALDIMKNHNAKDITLQRDNIDRSKWINEDPMHPGH